MKRDEVKGEWIKLHIGELHNLYSSPNINRVIKSRRMRWGEGADEYIHNLCWMLKRFCYFRNHFIAKKNVKTCIL
jgi:hypothetical protein